MSDSIFDVIDRRFMSGNSVCVERARQSGEGREPVAKVISGYSGDPDTKDSLALKAVNLSGCKIGDKLYTHQPKAQGAPKGWKFERESGDRITIDADGLGFYVARIDAERIADTMLYALAQDLLSTIPPSDKSDGKWVSFELGRPTGEIVWYWDDYQGTMLLSRDAAVQRGINSPAHNPHWMPTGLTRPADPTIGGD